MLKRVHLLGLLVGVFACTVLVGIAVAASSGTYKGIEAKVPAGYAKPTIKKGTKCVIGYDQVFGAVPSLTVEQKGAAAEAKRLGCKFIAKDAAGDVQKQLSNINDMLVQGITALITYPLDPKALQPAFNRASARKIPIIGLSTPGIAGHPLPKGMATQVMQGFDRDAYETMKNLAARKPRGSFGIIGYAAPIPALKYFVKRAEVYGKQFGMKFLGVVDEAASATPQDQQAAATSLLAKYPKIDAVVSFNDPTALSAATIARQSGKNIVVTGSNGDSEVFKAIRSGRILSTFAFKWSQMGAQAVRAAYNLQTKQHLPLPKATAPVGQLVTKSNASKFTGA